MDSVFELVPQSGLARLGNTFHPCVAGPAGHLTVYGHELRPLTLAEGELLSVYARDGGPDSSAALALRMASSSASPDDDGAGSFQDVSPAVRCAVEAVALFLAGATGTGALPGAGVLLARRLGLPLVQTLELTVLAADALAPPALPEAPLAGSDDGWTTYEIAARPELQDQRARTVTPDAPAPRPSPDTEVRRVRDLLASRLMHRLTTPAATAAEAATHHAEWSRHGLGSSLDRETAMTHDRWGAPVETVPTAVPAHGPSAVEALDAASARGTMFPAPAPAPAVRAEGRGTSYAPPGWEAEGDAFPAIRSGATTASIVGQPPSRADSAHPNAGSPPALHPSGLTFARPETDGCSPWLTRTGRVTAPDREPDHPGLGDPRKPPASPWDTGPAGSSPLAEEGPLAWEACLDPDWPTLRGPDAEPSWTYPPAGQPGPTIPSSTRQERGDATARAASSSPVSWELGRTSASGRALEPGEGRHPFPPPTGSPEPAEPGASVDVDAVALQLAQDLQAIADLNGVPR